MIDDNERLRLVKLANETLKGKYGDEDSQKKILKDDYFKVRKLIDDYWLDKWQKKSPLPDGLNQLNKF